MAAINGEICNVNRLRRDRTKNFQQTLRFWINGFVTRLGQI